MTNTKPGQPKVINEVKEFLEYISACEAAWSGYLRLKNSLIDGQSVVFNDDDNLFGVMSKETVKMSMITEWVNCNKEDDLAKILKYVQFPRHYVWNRKKQKWFRRKRPFGSVGRIHYVPPSLGECYYMRLLLNHVVGPTCYEDIKTVDGEVFGTFKEACFALGLLDDDMEYVNAIKEASTWSSRDFLKSFFVMLMTNSVSRPFYFWSETKQLLMEDILYQQRKITNIPDLILQDSELENLCLSRIEKLLLSNGSTLKYFPDMPIVDMNYVSSFNNRLIVSELSYDRGTLQREHDGYLRSLTPEQHALSKDAGGVFLFIYGYSGTGKTFLWKTFSAAIRSKGEVVLNVASSGIASLLLDGGRTAHSRFV